MGEAHHGFRYYLCSLLLPSSASLIKGKTDYESEIAIARVGLALKLFKQATGAYPATLAKLTPEFIQDIPVDPFTGQALIYRKIASGFILYSLGPNLQDDNGVPKPVNDTPNTPHDIVWQCAE